ncbi:MAG: radical SAM protein [Nitrospiraceae bacterium]|nr:radical SAM protein [Nitrospiraceae bacterium]
MRISEIFTSIQGETTYTGRLSTFIRLAGCNLRCSYCDTKYAYDSGVELSETEIMNEVSVVGVNLITITGGEPLLQEEVFHLTERLLNDGHKVLIETNGSLSIKDLDPRAVVVLDIKTPGSGMWEEMDASNMDFLKHGDEVKFVIVNRMDYEWARDFVKAGRLPRAGCKVLFSPAFGLLEPAGLASWMLQDRLNVIFNLQAHKYIFGPEKRGV